MSSSIVAERYGMQDKTYQHYDVQDKSHRLLEVHEVEVSTSWPMACSGREREIDRDCPLKPSCLPELLFGIGGNQGHGYSHAA